MSTYVVLMRGINVGGKNRIAMTQLKLCLESQGFENVRTYLNSGNVLLESNRSREQITYQIEEMLPVKFSLDSSLIKALVLSHSYMQTVIDQAPEGFGEDPSRYYSDVIFLMGITLEEALPVFSPKEGIDRIWPGTGVIYSQRLSALRAKSRLSRIIGTPAYKSMTIRSWNTTTKLLEMLKVFPVTPSTRRAS